jgi:nucleoid-associated protein YgaU
MSRLTVITVTIVLFQWGCQSAAPRASQPARPVYKQKQTLDSLSYRRLDNLLPPHGARNKAFNQNRVVLTGYDAPVPQKKHPVYISHTKRQPQHEAASHRTGSSTLRQHRVRRGETLYHISRNFYGDGNQWQKIVRANAPALSNPDRLRVGMVLVIP